MVNSSGYASVAPATGAPTRRHTAGALAPPPPKKTNPERKTKDCRTAPPAPPEADAATTRVGADAPGA